MHLLLHRAQACSVTYEGGAFLSCHASTTQFLLWSCKEGGKKRQVYTWVDRAFTTRPRSNNARMWTQPNMVRHGARQGARQFDFPSVFRGFATIIALHLASPAPHPPRFALKSGFIFLGTSINDNNCRITFGHVSPRTLSAQVAIEKLPLRSSPLIRHPRSRRSPVWLAWYSVLSAFWYFCHVFLSSLGSLPLSHHLCSRSIPPPSPPSLSLYSLSCWLCPFP